ncbi:NAD(P)H-nitrite reductase [Synechococcus sp. PCC 7502]|uniref:NAD(P)/FAD-dependent oxidoreductase n=1 Tax=Synechococcus sp. PCC 7502 TaxID=1173263 RepID=UPI00029FB719|nr:FAD-dependent oxidoreductase [Synechococcus sp. PCC 7502]AFY74804.1 NAD(P)H-nitrite reductase [Synechococcus sp. PCC 7502]
MTKNYYIIGAGVAGITAAEYLRQNDSSCQITVINGESYPFYRRLSLSSYLQRQTTLESLIVKKPEDYQDLKIFVLQDRVTELKPTEKLLIMASGATYAYDGLIIATGGSAIRPPIAGIDLKGVRLGYWDIKDTLWYEQQAKTVKNAVVIGGGVLGLELADSFNKLGLNVTIVQLGNYLGEPLTDLKAGKIVGDRVRASGASYRLGVSAQAIVGNDNGAVRAVVTSKGEEIPADVVGVCIGIRPNTLWLKDSGIAIEQGCIIVDEFLKTNFDHTYAAGDCTLVKSANWVGDRPNRTWQVATNQGMVAANNLANSLLEAENLEAKKTYQEGLFYNAGVIYDLPYTMLGKFNPDPDDSKYQTYTYDTEGDRFAYFKLTVSDGRLVGAMLIGKQRRTNILRKIIEGNYIITGHELELMDTKFKPTGLPIADIARAGDADVGAKLAAYAN